MMKRAAETTVTNAVSATGLVVLIVVLIVAYIVFLPPAERQKLLEGETNESENESNGVSAAEGTILVLEYPGRVDFLKDKDEQHDIAAFYLYKTTNAEELETANPFIIRHGLFDEVKKEIPFAIKDLENTDNVALSFSLKRHSGVLTIMLNGVNIFESELNEANPQPITLRKEYLKEQNVLTFTVSSSGARFWTTNEYSFDNVRITGDVTDTSRQESSNVFAMTDKEVANLEMASLRYLPHCEPDEVGKLDIMINYHEVFSGVPDCGSVNIRSVPVKVFNPGDNTIVFKTNKGSYLVEQIMVKTRLQEVTYPTYYFELNETTFEKIQDDELDVKLTLKFIDDKEDKTFNLNVNNRMAYIDTAEKLSYRNIDRDVIEGNNFIKIEPLSTLDIVELRVELE